MLVLNFVFVIGKVVFELSWLLLTALVHLASLWIYVLVFYNYSIFCYSSGLTVSYGFGKSFFLILVVVFSGWSSKLYLDLLVVLRVAIGFIVVTMVCC